MEEKIATLGELDRMSIDDVDIACDALDSLNDARARADEAADR
jgi:hypothetical protein